MMNKTDKTSEYFVNVMAALLGIIPILCMILWGGIVGFGKGIAKLSVEQWVNWKDLWYD